MEHERKVKKIHRWSPVETAIDDSKLSPPVVTGLPTVVTRGLRWSASTGNYCKSL